MAETYNTEDKFCEKCGSVYRNFCVECERRALPEEMALLMNKYGMTQDRLVKELATFIVGGECNLAALKIALGMRGMSAPQKVEAVVEDKGATDASKLAAVLAKLNSRK